MNKLVTTISTAEIKLNKSDKDFKKVILLHNEHGYKIVTNDLCSLDFIDSNALKDIEIKNINKITTIPL